MDLLQKTKELCRLYEITPARSKGQNFLIKEEIYDKIIESAELKPNDVILEVGPGFGFLTAKLAEKVKKVIAVELDDKLANILKTGLIAQGIKNVEVINEDILKFSIGKAPMIKEVWGILSDEYRNVIPPPPFIKGAYKIVANLPYNITSIFLRKFLSEEKVKPELMVLMLQKEVAKRIVARPPDMSLLAMSVQFYAQPEIVEHVAKNNFWPEPEVDSAIIKIKPHLNPLLKTRGGETGPYPNSCLASRQTLLGKERKYIDVDKESDFFRLIKFGFSAKRKMLKNNLVAGYRISSEKIEKYLKLAKINEKARAQELSLIDWLRLFEVIG